MTYTGYPKGVHRIRRRPGMTNYRGRVWKTFDLILPDGSKTAATLDETWGALFYFQVNDQWWKAPIEDYKVERGGRLHHLDLREGHH